LFCQPFPGPEQENREENVANPFEDWTDMRPIGPIRAKGEE
jgi:hypothetical protein